MTKEIAVTNGMTVLEYVKERLDEIVANEIKQWDHNKEIQKMVAEELQEKEKRDLLKFEQQNEWRGSMQDMKSSFATIEGMLSLTERVVKLEAQNVANLLLASEKEKQGGIARQTEYNKQEKNFRIFALIVAFLSSGLFFALGLIVKYFQKGG